MTTDSNAGHPTHTITVIGEPNRVSSVSIENTTSGSSSNKKNGDVSA